MYVKTVCIREVLSTVRTEIGSLSCVDSHVFLQYVATVEASLTLSTGEGLHAGVNFLVRP